jgi:hypothetical protein
VRDSRYHGGFDHPVRAFLIGVSLLVLLFGGFVVGIEAGTHPSSGVAVRTITLANHRLRVVTVQQPVVRTTVGPTSTIVRLLGRDRAAALVRQGDSTLLGYLSPDRGRLDAGSAYRNAETIFLPEPTTVTETVTETATETVTETVTDTTGGGSTTSTDTTSTP